MKASKNILLLFFLTSSLLLTSQTNETTDSAEVVGINPEEMAQFPGGLKEFSKYIVNSIGYTISLTKEELEIYRKPYAKFVIDEKGQVDNVKIIRSSNVPRVDSLFSITLSKMPKWNPSKFNGAPKRQEFNVPLTICFK